MQAAVLYGPQHVTPEDLPLPSIGESEVLVRVATATTCGTDLKVFRKAACPAITPPAVFGHEFSGTVVARGAKARHPGRHACCRQQLSTMSPLLLLLSQSAKPV